ncbi:MAG: InlB B-repeat-containing protein, partial [Oscillospiraceae bacterium]|nr:InlB B-repeat-containing protein [Oscillospiraceae bacterium]
MRRTGKKLLALCLTAILIIGLLPATALAVGIGQGSANKPAEIQSGYIPMDYVGGNAITDAYLRGDSETVNKLSPQKTRATLPSSYDSRSYGYITSVKNQNPYGTCWAFGTMAPIEAYMIKHGIINNDTGAAATTSMDLSESHLAWFNYTKAYDKMGMLNGDSTSPVLSAAGASSYLDMGGNGAMATFTVMRWEGPASENTSALKYSNVSTSGLNAQYAYDYNVAHVTDVEWIPVSNRDAVKEAIMEYGAATISYYHSDSYLNSSTGAYCFKQSAAYGSNNYQYGNHAVTVVGWDDNYSKSNFKSSYGPSSNGAWIIKNSWGSSWGKSGYFYLSYEDSASLNDECFFYKVSNLDNYANCYQYDGTCNVTNYQSMGNNCQIANVFTANSSESLKAVAIAPWDEATTYTLKIYKNPSSATNPSSGTLMTTQEGYFEYAGYYTIPLDNPVALSAGDQFAVVFTLSTPSADPDDGKYVHIPYDATASISWCKWTHTNHGNTSFYKEANGSWTDVPNNGDFRIKAYTDDASYTVTAVSNNTAYGTVSVNGNKITATPKSGYYVSDAQVISGTATVSISGNIITVNPSSDCTVQVIFAVKPQLTVNFVACGASAGSQTAYINDAITLPATAAAVSGYTFVGWTSAQVAETTNKPAYYAPGASYTVTANATLYALYTRTEGSSEIIYEIVADPITDWTGKYVITSGKDSSMYVLKGMTGDTSYESASAGGTVTFANSGMTLENGVLKNVGNAYVFEAAPASTGYSLKNLSTNTYVGSYNNYLYSRSSYSASYCVWDLEYDTYNICMKVSNTASSNYPYMVKGSGAYFVINSGYTTNKTQLWKQTTASTTYYNTNPTAVTHTHTAGAAVQENVVPATCTAAGSYDEVVYCAACGEEMSRTHRTVAALGHNPGASVQENYVAPTATTDGGYDTVVYCTRCSAELSREHTTLPATGVTTYYTVSFSVPNGLTAPASQTVAAGSAVTLPTASAPSGYTFLGWVTVSYDNVSTMPTILTGAYTPTADITLKAIYSYTEGSGASVYQLVSSAPSNWAGSYVITNGNSTSMYVLKGVTPSSNGAEIENSS